MFRLLLGGVVINTTNAYGSLRTKILKPASSHTALEEFIYKYEDLRTIGTYCTSLVPPRRLTSTNCKPLPPKKMSIVDKVKHWPIKNVKSNSLELGRIQRPIAARFQSWYKKVEGPIPERHWEGSE
ncbi:hypothetical protein F5051DRAFT_427065 [Lentinula edodes]|nr:hypothetical protein F5051DRAFT_427065 [Lentinula edodes]